MSQTSIMELYSRRDFGKIIGDSFKYVFRNFGSLLSVFLTWVVPIFLIGAVLFSLLGKDFMKVFSQIYDVDNQPDFGESMLRGLGMGSVLLYVFIALAQGMLSVCVVAHMKVYDEAEGQVDLRLVNKLISAKALRVFGFYLLWLLFFVMIYGVVILGFVLSPILGVILLLSSIPIAIYIYLHLSLATPILVCEEGQSFQQVVKRCFLLLKGRWWWMFGVVIILNIITSMCSGIFAFPFYIYSFVKGLVSLSNEGSLEFGMIGTLFFLFSVLGGLFCRLYYNAGRNLIYFKLIEEKEGKSISEKIESISKEENKYFGNEGEF